MALLYGLEREKVTVKANRSATNLARLARTDV
jgi:hypothetical protein